MRLTEDDLAMLHRAASMQFSGGTMPYTYGEYLRLEKLRRWRLLRFWLRRSRRWNWCQYTITYEGHSKL